MAKDFAKRFYNSTAWKETRAAYAKSKGYLCEVCLAKGIYKPSAMVHHKVELTPNNINEPNVTLNWNNLQCVCRDCHADIHDLKQYQVKQTPKVHTNRYKVDSYGRIIPTEPPP